MPEVELLIAGLLVAGILAIGHFTGLSLSRYALLHGHAGHVLWPVWVRVPVSLVICGLVPVVFYSALNAGLTGRVCLGTMADNLNAAVIVGLFTTGFCGEFFQRPRKPREPARKSH